MAKKAEWIFENKLNRQQAQTDLPGKYECILREQKTNQTGDITCLPENSLGNLTQFRNLYMDP